MTKLQYVSIDEDGNKITAVIPANKGRKPQFNLLHYRNCKLGDSRFIATGKRPKCSWCGNDRENVSCVEIETPELFGVTHYELVMQCPNCAQLTVFKYQMGDDDAK